MKRLLIALFLLNLLISGCVKKSTEPDSKAAELDIWPSKNRLELIFDYNGNNYMIEFIGKEKTMAIARIVVNKEPYNYDDDIVLSNEDVFLINEELKNPEIAIPSNKSNENNMIINVKYRELHTEYIKEAIFNFDDELGEDKEFNMIASDRLKDYLINRLLYIYSLPLYTVQDNDTLSKICLKFFGDTNYDRIVDVNPSMEWKNQYLIVRPHEKIRIP